MPKFDLEKVITAKDYLLNRGLVEKGMTYYAFSILEEDGPQSYEKIVFDFYDNELGLFVSTDRKSYDYLYPYEEPQKKYRPFKQEELLGLLGKPVKNKNNDTAYLITAIDLDKTATPTISVCGDWYDVQDLYDDYEFINADGTTSLCGVLEEE